MSKGEELLLKEGTKTDPGESDPELAESRRAKAASDD